MVGGGEYMVGNVERCKDSLPEPSVISNYNQRRSRQGIKGWNFLVLEKSRWILLDLQGSFLFFLPSSFCVFCA